MSLHTPPPAWAAGVTPQVGVRRMNRQSGVCMGCMSYLENGRSICARCGYDNEIPNQRGALPTGAPVGGSYIVGKVIRHSDLTITYLGLHTGKNVKVFIEEFYPHQLVERGGDGCTIVVPEQNRIRYKTLYSDMADRWKRLSKLDARGIVKIKELFPEWGTMYCVMPYTPDQPLEQRLEENGSYSWPEAKEAFLPLFTAVSNLHNQGLTHCGISPENILVNRRGQLVLIGFSLPELRTEGSGITPELYAGYSAPEQYSKNMWQGEWTDVYSMGAVLYHVLTGRTPQPALERLKKDETPEAAAVNPAIPDNVSEALVKAMCTDKNKRYQSLDEFSAALLKVTTSNTAVFRPEPAEQPKQAPAGGRQLRLVLAGLAVALAASLIGNIVQANMLMTPQSLPEPESIAVEPPPELMTHTFTGVYLGYIQNNRTLYGNLVFTTEYEYNEEYPEGIVYDQSVKAGDLMPEDRTVTLYVSRGSQYINMPYLIGSSTNFASKTLTDLKVNFEFIYDDSPDSVGTVNTVIASNKGFGAKISRVDDQVVLTIKRESSIVEP